jgi:hypothetical protein
MPGKPQRGFPKKSEEIDATEAFRVHLGGERKTEYRFFMAPSYPGTRRLPHLERNGIEVWSVDV